MGVFEHFPYTNFHDLNLNWIIQELQKLTVSVQDFISINAIKYANPIQWDITSQYEKNTVVLDEDGNAYLSVQSVPAGVSLDRTEYWTNIGNFSALWESVKSAIAVPDEGHNTTASAARQPNTLVWVDGKLVEVTSAMKAGDRYNTSEDGNCRLYTMQMLLDALLGEVHDRENNFVVLSADIENEATQRKAADAAINENFAQEITDRKAADIAIEDKIDNNTILINVKNYGAVGDGSTDDTNAFKNALLAMADKKLYTLYIPNGTYLLTDTLNVQRGNINIVGESMYGTIIRRTTNYGNTFNFTGNDILTSITIANFAVFAPDDFVTTGVHFNFVNCQECTIRNIYTQNASGSIKLAGCVDFNIYHVVGVGRTTSGRGSKAIQLTRAATAAVPLCTQIRISNSRFFGPRVAGWDNGLLIDGVEDCVVDNCYFGNNAYHNIQILHTADNSCYEITISNCYIDASGSHAIYLNGNNTDGSKYISNTKIVDCNIKGQSGDGLSGIFADGTSRSGQYSDAICGLTIEGCTISGFKNSGLTLNHTRNTVVVGNSIFGNNFEKQTGGDGRGILMLANNDGFIISNNSVGKHSTANGDSKQLFGLQIVEGCTNGVVTGNDFTQNQNSLLIGGDASTANIIQANNLV